MSYLTQGQDNYLFHTGPNVIKTFYGRNLRNKPECWFLLHLSLIFVGNL